LFRTRTPAAFSADPATDIPDIAYGSLFHLMSFSGISCPPDQRMQALFGPIPSLSYLRSSRIFSLLRPYQSAQSH